MSYLSSGTQSLHSECRTESNTLHQSICRVGYTESIMSCFPTFMKIEIAGWLWMLTFTSFTCNYRGYWILYPRLFSIREFHWWWQGKWDWNWFCVICMQEQDIVASLVRHFQLFLCLFPVLVFEYNKFSNQQMRKILFVALRKRKFARSLIAFT